MGKNKNTRKFQASVSKKLKRSTASHSDQKASDCKSRNFVLRNHVTFTAAEKVFFIDHIMESIFLECDQRTLLRCRLVSRRSEYFATKALQRVVKIKFRRDKKKVSFPQASNFRPICFPYIFYSGCRKRSIPELVDLLNNSAEFPCTSFSFYNDSVSPATPALGHFLNTHASRVEKVKLNGNFYLEDFKELIFTLALNVEEVLVGDVNVKAVYGLLDDGETTEDEDTEESYVPLLVDEDSTSTEDDDDFSEDEDVNHAEVAPQEQSPPILTLPEPIQVLTSLKIFQCENPIPATIIHHILEACPSLVQVSLHHKNLHCLVQPRNFLHLVKKLVIDIDPTFDHDFDSLQLVAHSHENNWAVEEFEFSGFADDENEELQQKLLDSVHNILRGCSATCTKLILKTILENFKTPPQMPQVKHLTFPYQISFVTRQPRNMFPQGASLSDVFPSLRSLHINSRHNMVSVPIGNIFGGDHHPSDPNVKKVTLQFRKSNGNLVRSFHKMFPSASIRNIRQF